MVDWGNILSQVLYWGGIALGSVSIPTVIGVIVSSWLRSKNDKHLKSLDLEGVSTAAADITVTKTLGKMKTYTFKHDIEPIAEEKIDEASKRLTKDLRKDIKKIHEENAHIVKVIDEFSKFFDNSFYVSEENKEKLRIALDEAKGDFTEKELAESVLVEEPVVEDPKTEPSTETESPKTTSIER